MKQGGEEMPTAGDVGSRIAQLRKKSGLSQQQLADLVGTSTSAIGNYESGLRIPKDAIKIKIAHALKASIESIFFENELHITCNKGG